MLKFCSPDFSASLLKVRFQKKALIIKMVKNAQIKANNHMMTNPIDGAIVGAVFAPLIADIMLVINVTANAADPIMATTMPYSIFLKMPGSL